MDDNIVRFGAPTGLDAYRALSDDYVEPEASSSVGAGRIERIRAEGGPYDGVDLTVPPGGTAVVLPAAWGDGDLKGKVTYERQGDRMVYVGQTDQTAAIAEELEGRNPRQLILP